MISFAAAIVVGYVAGNETEVVILRATATMLVCWFVGRGVGGLAQRAVDKHIHDYKQRFPVPSEASDDSQEQDSQDEHIQHGQEQADQQPTPNNVETAPSPGT